MSDVVIKEVPRFECLLEFSKVFPSLKPKAFESFMHLVRLSDQIRQASQNYFTRKNISKGRFLVMMYLFAYSKGFTKEMCSAAKLADQSSCSRATMTGLIDSLEKDGFVQRIPDENDRRVTRLEITDKGEAFMNSILPGHFEHVNSFMEALTDSEHETLIGLLRKISDRLGVFEPLSVSDDCKTS